ncbi:MAG: uncharacterized protein QOG38_3201 [Hyphomicrobiales bacterium]|nr:uncharacterized protein [Hyphomicrobiales bacterium]
MLKLLALLVIAGLIGSCAAVLGVGLWLSAPAQTVIGTPPADLAAEAVEFPSASSATIRGWFVAGRLGGGAVVLMHGLRGNRLGMVRRARLLHAAGFSVLLFDLQAHGESTGKRITFGALEGRDAAAAVAFMKARLPGEKIGVIGTSLGGAAALLGPEPLRLDALVLEAVYPDIGAATANRVSVVLGARLGTIVSKPAARLFELLMAPIIGVKPSDLRPIDRIADIRAPVLIVGGARDDRTTAVETRALFDRVRDPKFLWMLEDAGHFDFEAHAPEQYRAYVLPFLAQRLQRPN